MNKLIAMLIFVILVSGCASPNSQSYSTYQTNYNLADEGSGPVEIRAECVQQINEYKFLVNEVEYSFVYALGSDGIACAWYGSPDGYGVAANEALKQCNNFAKRFNSSRCSIFAKDAKIVWDWLDMPDYFSGGRGNIDFDDVQVLVGSGPVSLSENVISEYDHYKYLLRTNKNNIQVGYGVFVISKDGQYFGVKFAGQLDQELAKKTAIAQCMTATQGEQCYIYAENEKIVWRY